LVSDADVSALGSARDILTLGMLADDARRQRHGVRTTFVRVADVPCEPGSTGAWPDPAGEIRIVGAPASSAAAVSRVRELAPQVGDVPLSGFSLADLEQLALSEGVTLRSLLEQLRDAGLELVAEAPVDRLLDARRSVEEVNIAGLSLARLTVHQWPAHAGASPSALTDFFRTVNALQRNVAVIRTFAPLPRRFNPAAPSTGYEDITRVAMARLLVDAIPSIQVDWALYGPKLAQVALTVGADDVDGVSAADDMSQGGRRSALEEIRRNIRAAGLDPVERGGRFDPIPARA
jgi:aminodeoxyfutalosine synthase